MRLDTPSEQPSRQILHWVWPVAALTGVALLGAWFLQSTIPHRIVLASGLAHEPYHRYAERYKEILARDGVTVEERLTGGPDENEQLLHDPRGTAASGRRTDRARRPHWRELRGAAASVLATLHQRGTTLPPPREAASAGRAYANSVPASHLFLAGKCAEACRG